MLKKSRIFALLTVFSTIAFAQSPPPVELPARENFHIFLLAGQSNMAGRGKLDELEEQDKKNHPRVLMLSKDGKWVAAADPIHYDKGAAGVGLGRFFAMYLAENNKDITIGLVPAACGGSPISTWVPGGYHSQTSSYPYDDAIKRVKLAMKDGVLCGVLWHQGESDGNEKSAGKYQERLIELIARFRKELESPKLPFLIGQLGRFEAKPWSKERELVNKAQQQVAKEVEFCGFVSAEGLTANEDNVHFNTKSLKVFGKRYAEEYIKIIEEAKKKVPADCAE